MHDIAIGFVFLAMVIAPALAAFHSHEQDKRDY